MNLVKLVYKGIFFRGVFFLSVLLLNVLIARFFKAVNSGLIYYVANYFSFIILLAGLSLESGMGFFGAKKSIKESRLAIFSLLWTSIVSLLVVLLLKWFYLPEQGLFSGQRFFICAVMYTPGCLLIAFFSALFFARQDFVLPNVLLAGTNGLLILLLFLGLRHRIAGASDTFFLNLYFFNYLLQGLILCAVYLRKAGNVSQWSLPTAGEFKSLLRFSVFALLNNIIFFILYRVDYWFLKNTCTSCLVGDLGNYIQVSKIVQLFIALPVVIGSTIFSRTAAGSADEVNTGLPIFSRIIISFYMLLMLALILTGKWLFPWIYGSSFDRMYIPFVALIPGIMGLTVVALLAAYNSGKNRLGINIKGSLVGLIIVLVGDWLFIGPYGIKAAAMVSSAGYLGYVSYLLYRFGKEYKISAVAFFIPVQGDWQRFKNLLATNEKN